VIQEVQKLRLH